tara:strand:+ start:2657 stop:2782 length:126 start_codon:yes stop_codon:yes gene_type:complete
MASNCALARLAWGVFSAPQAFMSGPEEVERPGSLSTSAGTG